MRKHIGSAALIAATIGFSVPAMALDVTPYGAIRVGTWYTSSTYYNPADGAAFHDADFTLDLQGNSLVGIRVKEGDFGGVAELGAYNPKNRSGGVELRLLFGEWDFGKGKLRVGYAPSPYVYRSEQTYDSDGGFNGYGSLWDGRHAQIKATLNNGMYLALMKPGTSKNGPVAATTNSGASWSGTPHNQTATVYAATNTNYDTYLPRTVLGYEGKSGIVNYGGGAALNAYTETQTNAGATAYKDEIYSYLAFAHTRIDLAPVELKFNLYGGRNIGNLMSNPAAAVGSFHQRNSAGRTADANTVGGWAQAGYVLNDKTKVFAGVSYETSDSNITELDDKLAAFANLQYVVTKNFKVVPEFTYLDDMNSTAGTKEPKIYAAGVKWEMSF